MPERCYTKAMKISDDSLEFLTELLETPSPSGFEIDAQRIWADELRKYTEDVQCDTYGNTWAVFHADDAGELAAIRGRTSELLAAHPLYPEL